MTPAAGAGQLSVIEGAAEVVTVIGTTSSAEVWARAVVSRQPRKTAVKSVFIK